MDSEPETINPDDLDQETLAAGEWATRGFEPLEGERRYNELDNYQQGRHEALSAVLAILFRWQDEMDEE